MFVLSAYKWACNCHICIGSCLLCACLCACVCVFLDCDVFHMNVYIRKFCSPAEKVIHALAAKKTHFLMLKNEKFIYYSQLFTSLRKFLIFFCFASIHIKHNIVGVHRLSGNSIFIISFWVTNQLYFN